MDATQRISDSILESDEEENEENENKRGRPLAKLCILKNQHLPEAEMPLFLGENVVGRDPNICTLPLPSPSISKQHATISISAHRRRGRLNEVVIEALVWDLGSMNGTRKGRLKLTPNVRYALGESDSLILADIPCQYVSCAEDTVSSQRGLGTPVSSSSGETARLAGASGEKGSDTSTGSKKCVNGGTQARVSLPDLKDTGKTPVGTSCLSFERTPTQPQGILVAESDSDSDGEKVGAADKRRKAAVSDSDSYKSSPSCSTFLSPTNKIVPESEDESPITPSVCSKNRPHRHVSFGKEVDVDVGRQELKEKKAHSIVDNSEEEETREEERAALGGRKAEERCQRVPDKQDSNVSLAGEDESPVSTPALFPDAIPVFNMDSDTDAEREEEEEEEEVAPVVSVTLSTNQQADQPSNTVQFHMDSDTDVDEDDEASNKVPKSVPSSADSAKTPPAVSVTHPEGITMDSDTDVDDVDAAVSDSEMTRDSLLKQGVHAADSSPSTQQKDFHIDSDTDVDEEHEKERGTINTSSEIDETPSRLEIKPSGPESAHAAPRSLNLDSDTDDKTIPALAVSEPSAVSAGPRADLDILSDSDTGEEVDSPLVIPFTVTTLSFAPSAVSEALQSGSDADTDLDESSVPPAAGGGVNPADLCMDSDTDVEDEGAHQGQIPDLCRGNTPVLLAPPLQNCSTPVQVSGTQTPNALSSCSDSQEDQDLVVAETQSFVLQARDCQGKPPGDHTMEPTQAFCLESSSGEKSSGGGSFQLGLSDSSHLRGQAHALATESTQAFVSEEDTQTYAAIPKADTSSLETDSNLDATQANGEEAGPAQVDLALQATQAYISEPCASGGETDEDETATAETQPVDVPSSSTLAMAETQLMPVFDEEEGFDQDNFVSSGHRVKGVKEEHGKAAQTQERPLGGAPSIAETQPMCVSDNDETDEEEGFDQDNFVSSGHRVKGVKGEHGKAAQTQERPLGGAPSIAETQPMCASDNEETDEEDFIPGLQKRKAKRLQIPEEDTQPLTNSEASTVEDEPLGTKPVPRSEKGKAGRSEAGTSGISIRGKRGTIARIREEEEEECSEPPKRLTRGTSKASPTPRGRRGKSRPDESEEVVEQAKRARGRKSTRQQRDDEETEGNTHVIPMQDPEEGRLGRDNDITETRSEMDNRERKREESRRRREEKEEEVRTQAENAERERKEQEDKGRADRMQKEKEEELERERKERDEQERLEREKAEREEKERREELERQRKEKEEQERILAEAAERLRLEQERATKEAMERNRKEQEERERIRKDKEEQLERERKERLEREKAEREEKERLEREEKAKIENERKEREEKLKRELEEKLERERREHQARLEAEAKERERLEKEKQEREAKEKIIKEQQESKEEENKPKTAARGRRAAKRTTEPEPERGPTDDDDAPARRTRSRSNSSNSVSSERSVSSANTQASRGRGRGAKRASEPPRAGTRISSRRRTAAAEPTERDGNDASPQGNLSRSNSNSSLTSTMSTCSLSSQGRGRGRQRGRGRAAETDLVDGQNSAPKPAARGRKSRKAEESSSAAPQEDDKEKQAGTTRGRRQTIAKGSEPAAADNKECANEESLASKRDVGGRGHKTAAASSVCDGDEVTETRRGRKREAAAEEDSSSGSKVSKVTDPQAQTSPAAEEDRKGETKDEVPVQFKRKGRASVAQTKKSSSMEVKEEEEAVGKRGRGRQSAVQKKKKEEREESRTSAQQDARVEPQTPTSSASRKRPAPDPSPVAKTPRSSTASPRLRAASQAYKVLFTGVTDEPGERVLPQLGGSMAKGVVDMNCLVTDKVRRTVKFLCAVAKGVPVVTEHWLQKSGKAGSFLSPNAFLVKDPEQEKKFNFCLEESLKIASSLPLLRGYEIHVTKSVKPEPVHMKDIIACSGATFLAKMPSTNKTVVISCEEDWPLCGPARAASLPVVTAEFILTGILQQKIDFQTHAMPAPQGQPAGGRGRARKKT